MCGRTARETPVAGSAGSSPSASPEGEAGGPGREGLLSSKLPARLFEELSVVSGGALLSSREHVDEQVRCAREVAAGRLAGDGLDHDGLAVGPERFSNVAEDGDGSFVVPVVDDGEREVAVVKFCWSRVRESNSRPHDYTSRQGGPAGVASCCRVPSEQVFCAGTVRLVLARVASSWEVRGQSVGMNAPPEGTALTTRHRSAGTRPQAIPPTRLPTTALGSFHCGR